MSVPAEDYSRNAIVCTKFDNMKFPQFIEKKKCITLMYLLSIYTIGLLPETRLSPHHSHNLNI
jgi:hypothetical protein